MSGPRGHSPETPDGTRWHPQKTRKMGISRDFKQLRFRLCGTRSTAAHLRRTNGKSGPSSTLFIRSDGTPRKLERWGSLVISSSYDFACAERGQLPHI